MTDRQQAPLDVLAVDDDPLILTLVARMVSALGHHPITARNGHEAVEIYRQHRGAYVLLDINMPDLDGPATLDLLRMIDPNVRCSFITGGTLPYSEPELLGRGAERVLFKPFSADDLAAILLTHEQQALAAGV